MNGIDKAAARFVRAEIDQYALFFGQWQRCGEPKKDQERQQDQVKNAGSEQTTTMFIEEAHLIRTGCQDHFVVIILGNIHTFDHVFHGDPPVHMQGNISFRILPDLLLENGFQLTKINGLVFNVILNIFGNGDGCEWFGGSLMLALWQ